jgi:hypothetical protein
MSDGVPMPDWFNDEVGDHEGYVVGLIADPDAAEGWRELGTWDNKSCQIETFKVACNCGWRSRVFHAGSRSRWIPNIVELGEDRLEDAARSIWKRHIADEAGLEVERNQGGFHLIPFEDWR